MFKNIILLNLQKDSLCSLTECCSLKKIIVSENFNIFANNIISIETTKVLL
jgi:hypothetical protein